MRRHKQTLSESKDRPDFPESEPAPLEAEGEPKQDGKLFQNISGQSLCSHQRLSAQQAGVPLVSTWYSGSIILLFLSFLLSSSLPLPSLSGPGSATIL